MQKPVRIQNVAIKVRKCVREGKYIFTLHALQRQKERFINLAEILHVLKTGEEEIRKTFFDTLKNTWKYAIRGKTLRDAIHVRVVVAFDDKDMIVITVMRVEKIK